MKKVIICTIILFLFFSKIISLRGVEKSPINFESLQIQELLEEYNIPGAAIAVINKESIRIRTYGYKDIISKEAVTDKTIFRIGSNSKSFLAIAVMQLVDEGKLNLNDTVKTILPEIEIQNSWADNYPVLIIHLLQHTSGIDDIHFNEGYNTTANQERPLKDIFSINPGSRNVRWKPGEFSSYSNDAFSVLALIIEKVTGQQFEAYLKQHVFDKIGVVSTSFKQTDNNASLFAQGYANDGSPLKFTQVMMRPSGGINSSISDLSRFVQMLLNNGVYNQTSILDSLTLTNMLLPSSSIPAKEGFKLGYGSGFSSFLVNGHRFFGHGGGLPDFNSIFLFHPQSEVGIVVLINKNSDYFWRIVNEVVSALNIEIEPQNTVEDYTTKSFKPADMVGYYTQVDYGISLDRFPNYFLSGQRIYYQNDTLFIKEFQSEKQVLINVNGNA